MDKIISLTLTFIVILGTISFASNNQELQLIEKSQTVSVEEADGYRASIPKEYTENNIKYQIVGIEKSENKKILTLEKEEIKSVVVPTNNKNEALTFFDSQIELEEDGYAGELKIQNDSLELRVNDSHIEKYKVTIRKQYNDVPENELNYIPKTIEQNGTTYYLTNPVWTISQTKGINGGDFPTLYNGTMNYEGIKERRVITSYLATVKYIGTLDKEITESITFNTKYEEIPKEDNNLLPIIVATTSGIIIFSGIIILKMRNVKVYNYSRGNECRLIKQAHISKKEPVIDITPIKSTSNKYKIKLSDGIYRELKNSSMKIKYFDRYFYTEIKEKEFDINV